jgi:transcriptional regulator with GAF, ATPase, and Fis domain
MESELFGHERGAFTGAAAARAGALEEAAGGTVFLDEIGELPLELQPKLLRFLELREVKRVGAARHRSVDVRVIAATNRKLSAEVEAGAFREDLYYRLSVVRVEIPPLRDRPADIRLLAHAFAQRYHQDSRVIITDEIEPLLLGHRWPGNVRQLRNVVERLAVVPELAAEDLRGQSPPAALPSIGPLIGVPFHEARRRWQESFERQYLIAQLERAGGVVTRAAELADLPRQTFHRFLRRHGLKGD